MQETLDFISNHRNDDVRNLALQASRYPNVDMPFAIDQIAGYQTALQKLPTYAQTAGIYYPHHLSMEQCSSEQTARHKAEIIANILSNKDSFADLTAGFGIDFSFIAPLFKQSTAIERQEYLCEIQQHNHPLLGLEHTQVLNTDAARYLENMKPVDWIFLDPARRDAHGGKVVAITDCEPNVAEWEDLLLEKANYVMVKLSPMLDITLAVRTLKHVREVHVVAVNNECKELLFILDKNIHSIENIQLEATNLTVQGNQTFRFTLLEEIASTVTYSDNIQQYLYEPNSALIKSGAFRAVAHQFQLQKLHPNSHLYTSNQNVPEFPGRCFTVESVSGFGKKDMKLFLQGLTQANLSVRNFPTSVADLRKRLKLKDGGDVYLFATTLKESEKVLIKCRKTEKNKD